MPKQNAIKVGLVEDDEELRTGLAFLIDNSPQTCCNVRCGSAEELLRSWPAEGCHVILLNIGLPGLSGIEAIQHIKQRSPHTEVMMLTATEEPEKIFDALGAGATGYLLKDTATENYCCRLLWTCITAARPCPIPLRGASWRFFGNQFPRSWSHSRCDEHQILEELAKSWLYRKSAMRLQSARKLFARTCQISVREFTSGREAKLF